MTVERTVALRVEELRRRFEALPAELALLKAETAAGKPLEIHASQIEALDILMGALLAPVKALFDDPPTSPDKLGAFALDVVERTIDAQSAWDFFRDKLLLRTSPRYRDALWMADTIAWDAYHLIIERAVSAGILKDGELREPPLTYLTSEPSPATWVRRSRPNDGRDYALGQARTPIPVIEIPWDHIENPWELLSILHEVGHDVEADLGLRPALRQSLNQALNDASVSEARTKRWLDWQGETFADLVALELGGPAFARALMHLLLLPPNEVLTFDDTDPHPLPYLRIRMSAAYIRTLAKKTDGTIPEAVRADADDIEATWKSFYGEPASSAPFLGDFSLVVRAMMDTPFHELKGKTVHDLVQFTLQHDIVSRKWADYIVTGQSEPSDDIKPRHVVSAARLAVSSVDPANRALLKDIRARAEQIIKTKAPSGQRGSGVKKSFIEGFAKFFRGSGASGGHPESPIGPTVMRAGEHGPLPTGATGPTPLPIGPTPKPKKPLPEAKDTDARWLMKPERDSGKALSIVCSWGKRTYAGLRTQQPTSRGRSPDNLKALRWRDMPVPRKRSGADGQALSALLPSDMVTIPDAPGGGLWRLFFTSEAPLADDIVWEWTLVRRGGDDEAPVSLSPHVRFARSVSPRYPISPLPFTGPLKVLVVAGAKAFRGEAAAIRGMIEAAGGASVMMGLAPSQKELGALLARKHHVVHYVGASAVDHGEGCLVLAGGDPDEPSEWIRPSELAALLPATTRLLCLSSPPLAKGALGLAKIALSPANVRLPTTLASQYASSPAGLDAFWKSFYQRFTKAHYDAVEATFVARRGALQASPDTADFAAHALVVRDGSGVCFKRSGVGTTTVDPVARERVRLANMLAARAESVPPDAAKRLLDAADDEWNETP